MFVSILMFVLAVACIVGGILTIRFRNEDRWGIALPLFALVVNFCVAGGYGLANVNILTGQAGDLNAYVLPIANFGASLIYGAALMAGILAVGAFCAVLKAIVD